MKSYSVVFFLCLSAGILATDDPATGHYLGKKPSDSWISTVSPEQNSDVQAAECSHNTRMSNQKFAWFQIDPSKVNQNQSTYGTCFATDQAPSESDLEVNSGYDVFFWKNTGGESGVGTGPTRNLNSGESGYEDKPGAFHTGNDPSGGSNSGGNSISSPSSTKDSSYVSPRDPPNDSYKNPGGRNTGTTPSGSGTIPTSSVISNIGTHSSSIDPGTTSSGETLMADKSGHKYTPNDNPGSNPYGIWKLNRKRFSLIL